MMQRIPKATSAHTACSRELPQPKLDPVTRIGAPWYCGFSSTKSDLEVPSEFRRM